MVVAVWDTVTQNYLSLVEKVQGAWHILFKVHRQALFKQETAKFRIRALVVAFNAIVNRINTAIIVKHYNSESTIHFLDFA